MGATASAKRVTRALIVAPTRELVVQIEENVRAYAKYLPLRMATVVGGLSERPQIQALRSGVDLVIATPGRLLDLMSSGMPLSPPWNSWYWMKGTGCSTWDLFRKFAR